MLTIGFLRSCQRNLDNAPIPPITNAFPASAAGMTATRGPKTRLEVSSRVFLLRRVVGRSLGQAPGVGLLCSAV